MILIIYFIFIIIYILKLLPKKPIKNIKYIKKNKDIECCCITFYICVDELLHCEKCINNEMEKNKKKNLILEDEYNEKYKIYLKELNIFYIESIIILFISYLTYYLIYYYIIYIFK